MHLVGVKEKETWLHMINKERSGKKWLGIIFEVGVSFRNLHTIKGVGHGFKGIMFGLPTKLSPTS